MGLVSIIFWALLFTMMIKSCTSSYANMGTVEVPYTTFKEWWGCTPTEHRDRCRAYLEQAPRLTVVKEAEAATLLKEYITDWHLQKVFV